MDVYGTQNKWTELSVKFEKSITRKQSNYPNISEFKNSNSFWS